MKNWKTISIETLCMMLITSAALDAKPDKNYFGWTGQDKYAHEQFFKNKTDGIFVDIGANNGIKGSDTYFFEKSLGWTGICVEPIPEVFSSLEKNRDCICINGCIANFNGTGTFLKVSGYPQTLSGLQSCYDPRHLQRIDSEIRRFGGSKELIEVECYTLESLLERYGIDHIDLLNIDTEGNELSILKTIDFDKYDIDVINVENNYSSHEIRNFLKEKGYQLARKNGVDEIYRKITAK